MHNANISRLGSPSSLPTQTQTVSENNASAPVRIPEGHYLSSIYRERDSKVGFKPYLARKTAGPRAPIPSYSKEKQLLLARTFPVVADLQKMKDGSQGVRHMALLKIFDKKYRHSGVDRTGFDILSEWKGLEFDIKNYQNSTKRLARILDHYIVGSIPSNFVDQSAGQDPLGGR